MQFSPFAILMYCWCSEHGLSVSTPEHHILSVFPSRLLFSCHDLQSACPWSMESLLTANTRTDTERKGLILQYKEVSGHPNSQSDFDLVYRSAFR